MRQPTPEGIRRRVLETARAQADADAAALLRVVEVGDDLYCAAVQTTGDEDLGAALQRQADRPVAGLGDLDLHAPPPLARRSLTRLPSVNQHADARYLPPLGAVADAIDDAAHLLLYHERALVGWLVLVRREGSGKFHGQVLGEAPASAMAAAVDQAFRAEPDPLRSGPATVVLQARGDVEYASAAARPWLTPERRAAMGRVLAVVREPVPGECLYVTDGVVLGLQTLEWNGRAAYLGVLERAQPPRIRPDAELSVTQRAVARHAAAGATTPEIARRMERSVETVRSHMKEIYRRLGVTSRLELARALRACS